MQRSPSRRDTSSRGRDAALYGCLLTRTKHGSEMWIFLCDGAILLHFLAVILHGVQLRWGRMETRLAEELKRSCLGVYYDLFSCVRVANMKTGYKRILF